MKRVIDFLLALLALLLLSPVLLVLTILGAVIMRGNPFFVQPRPGKDEKIFDLIKFRTMTCERDANGELLPDDQRMTGYGKLLRASSLDELPELINIIKGDMAIVGPRPQLVVDMVFMTDTQRNRHKVRQGLTGLAQVNGRNDISWEEKIAYDLKYMERITLLGDLKIIFKTVGNVLRRDGITAGEMDTAQDLGDYLLEAGVIDAATYQEKKAQGKALLEAHNRKG